MIHKKADFPAKIFQDLSQQINASCFYTTKQSLFLTLEAAVVIRKPQDSY